MRRVFQLLAAGCLFGCAGTSTGNPVPPHPTPGDPCGTESTPLQSVDSSTPLGFTAREALSLALGTHAIDTSWVPTEDPAFSPTPGSRAAISVTVTAPDPKPRYVAPSGDVIINGGMGSPSINCAHRIEADTHVKVTSSDGLLKESFDGTLQASTSDSAMLGVNIRASDIGGNVRLGPGEKAYALDGIRISLTFASGAMSGVVTGIASSATGTTERLLLQWPEATSDCDGDICP